MGKGRVKTTYPECETLMRLVYNLERYKASTIGRREGLDKNGVG